jgi:hypothetical protein
MTRDDIFKEAVRNCYRELYRKAQPSADYDEIIEKVESGEIEDNDKNPVYKRYYLSMEEFTYIRDKYLDAYKMRNTWIPNIDVLKSYFTEGGTKDKYVPEHTDEDGFTHPGYRGYEKVLPFKQQVLNYLKDNGLSDDVQKISEGINEIAIGNINDCKDFYRFDREESDFAWAVTLGASPTSNKQTVIDYWKTQGIELKIEDRNPLLLWEMDEYGDNFEEVMEDEYGEDWKREWWERYETEKQAKQAKKDALEKMRNIVENKVWHGIFKNKK